LFDAVVAVLSVLLVCVGFAVIDFSSAGRIVIVRHCHVLKQPLQFHHLTKCNFDNFCALSWPWQQQGQMLLIHMAHHHRHVVIACKIAVL
jgi:hypothetical protein